MTSTPTVVGNANYGLYSYGELRDVTSRTVALFRRRSREVQEGLRAAWQELLDPAKAG